MKSPKWERVVVIVLEGELKMSHLKIKIGNPHILLLSFQIQAEPFLETLPHPLHPNLIPLDSEAVLCGKKKGLTLTATSALNEYIWVLNKQIRYLCFLINSHLRENVIYIPGSMISRKRQSLD